MLLCQYLAGQHHTRIAKQPDLNMLDDVAEEGLLAAAAEAETLLFAESGLALAGADFFALLSLAALRSTGVRRNTLGLSGLTSMSRRGIMLLSFCPASFSKPRPTVPVLGSPYHCRISRVSGVCRSLPLSAAIVG